MKLLLLDTKKDKHYTGDTRADLVAKMVEADAIAVSWSRPKAVIEVAGFGAPISLQFSDEYSAEEMVKEINKGIIEQLCLNYGFVVFKDVRAN